MKFFANNAGPLTQLRQSCVLQLRFNNSFPRQDEVQKIPTWILVVALALFDDQGRLLLQQRPIAKHHGGLWEFPGGKVESTEEPANALVREIAEELALTLDPSGLEPCFFAEEGHDPAIVLSLYTSRQPVSQPQGLEGQAWGWFSLHEAALLPLAPMDRQLLLRMDRLAVDRGCQAD